MNRRTFIGISSAVSASIILPLSSCSSKLDIDEILATPISLLIINEPDSIRKLGVFYLSQMPNEANKDVLKNIILENLEDTVLSDSPETEFLKNSIIEKIRYDFITGNTLIVDGWILSKTEARQCALFSLINK